MKKQKLHQIHVKMILDYSGAMSIRRQPRVAEQLRSLLLAFQTENPIAYQKAFDVIVNKKVPDGDNGAVIASKISEIVESNIDFQKNQAIDEIKEDFKMRLSMAQKEIKGEAQREIEKAKKEFITIQVKVGTKKPKKIKGIVCEEFPRLLQLAQERINIMMVGPAGCGKTHIAGQLASALELEYASQSCSAGMSESQLTGWLLPIGKSGSFTYVSSEFIRLYENGGVFLFDEMDAADPNVLIFINQALANGQFSLPQRFDNPTIKKHKDFVAIAATNTFGGGADTMYHARNALDASTLDRFKIGMVPIGYSEKVEEQLVNKYVLHWGRQIRSIINAHGMRKIMSTRVLKDATQMVSGQGWKVKDVAQSYFSDWSREEVAVILQTYPDATNPDENNMLSIDNNTFEVKGVL